MFTGIVQALGIVLLSTPTDAGRRLNISLADFAGHTVDPGNSVAVSGVCLTALQKTNGNVAFDVVAETLNRTNLGRKISGDRVNLEFSLVAGAPNHGHFVQGHVEGMAEVLAIQNDSDDWRLTLALPEVCRDTIVPKGSVALDGVSMTIASTDDNTFTVAVIPTTLHATTLGSLAVGDMVNVESDILARTVAHILRNRSMPEQKSMGQRPAAQGIQEMVRS